MKTRKENNHLLIEPAGQSLTEFSSVLTQQHEDFKDENVIVNLGEYENAGTGDLLSFLEISDRHRMERKSFVIVSSAIDIDKIPDELIIAPTLQEAEDIIEMEEIERDLEE